MRYLWFTITMVLFASGALFAQGFGPATGGNTVMVDTTKGLYVLRNAVLAKFNATTLKQEGNELELFGKAPEPPADPTDRVAMQKYFTDLQPFQAPAIMFAKDNALILVIGDGFARINQDTLKPEVATKLSTAGAATETTRAEAAPSYLLVENTLYLMRGKTLVSVNIKDGKSLAVELPKELQTLQLMGVGRTPGNTRTGGARGGN